MYTAADFRQALEDYVEYTRELTRNMSPMSGILGVLGFKSAKPGYDPGHEKFFREMKNAVAEVCEEKPDPAAAEDIINVIFDARKSYSQEGIDLYMFAAIEGLTKDLVPFLSPESASRLYTQYKKDTPWNMRAPVQKEVLAALEKASKSGA